MAVIIYSASGNLRTVEQMGFTENLKMPEVKILEDSLYDGYVDEVMELVNDVQSRIYDFSNEMHEVETMHFSLLEVPEESVADFNILYSKVQSYLTRCASILITINKEKGEWQSLKSKAERIYKKIQNFVYANDIKIKELKNQALQLAYAEEKMPSLIRVLQIIESVIPDLKSLEDRVQIRLNDLDRANTNLNRQQKITEDLIALNHPVRTFRSLNLSERR
jgi:hypothetical protein